MIRHNLSQGLKRLRFTCWHRRYCARRQFLQKSATGHSGFSKKSKIENDVTLQLPPIDSLSMLDPKCRLLRYGTPGPRTRMADESLPLILVSPRPLEQ